MARILLLAFVLTCVVLVTESKTLKKSAFSSKVKAVRDSINKKEAIETSKFNLRSGDDGAVAAAEALSKGQEALGAVLDGANKRGIATPFSKGKSTKKSYEEVFFAADFVIGVVTAFSMAPCTVGMIAFEDILSNVDWEAIDWSQTTDQISTYTS
uniref:Uncharacterized protein LOC100371970 n=1 Tax=Saccoglossus kowalevskii TaxID=10224 RepID=A0ABM0M887_SACKO|nr:PREDICTED: uncharacterized protein LOC100371970 [Saccoglossus kowalevskii]